MIKITKTIIDVDKTEFYNEVKRVCEDIQRFNRSSIGTKFTTFKRELGLKITPLQFYNLCAECGIVVRRDVIWFDQFDQLKTDKK